MQDRTLARLQYFIYFHEKKKPFMYIFHGPSVPVRVPQSFSIFLNYFVIFTIFFYSFLYCSVLMMCHFVIYLDLNMNAERERVCVLAACEID